MFQSFYLRTGLQRELTRTTTGSVHVHVVFALLHGGGHSIHLNWHSRVCVNTLFSSWKHLFVIGLDVDKCKEPKLVPNRTLESRIWPHLLSLPFAFQLLSTMQFQRWLQHCDGAFDSNIIHSIATIWFIIKMLWQVPFFYSITWRKPCLLLLVYCCSVWFIPSSHNFRSISACCNRPWAEQEIKTGKHYQIMSF